MKMSVNHMQFPMHRAKSKRTGKLCRSPAVRGWKVCRMHGAGGGAPKGTRNGNYRHGECTIAQTLDRRGMNAPLRRAHETLHVARQRRKKWQMICGAAEGENLR